MEEISKEQQNKLVEENLKLVSYIVSKNFRSYIGNECFADLLQEGNIGIIKAARNFNPSLGFAFSTYAASKIDGEVRRYLRDIERGGALKIPRAILDTQVAIMREQEINPLITVEELATKLEKSIYSIIKCMAIINGTTSLDAPISEKSEDTFVDLLEGKETGYEEIEHEQFVDSLAALANRVMAGYKADIIEEYLWSHYFFGDVPTQQEIAKIYNITQTTVSRIISKFKNEAIKAGLIDESI